MKAGEKGIGLALGAVLLAAAAFADTRGGGEVQLLIDSGDYEIQVLWGCSLAHSGAWNCTEACPDECPNGHGDSRTASECSSSGYSYAGTVAAFGAPPGCDWFAEHEARTTPISAWVRGRVGTNPGCPCDPPFGPIGAAWGYASAQLRIQVTPVLAGSGQRDTAPWEATVAGLIPDPFEGGFASYAKVTRYAIILTGADENVALLAWANGMVQAMGAMPVGDDWSIDMVQSGGAGTFTLDLRPYTFDDAGLDVTGVLGFDAEGRFNELDVDALLAELGSTDPDLLERWDVNDNGIIDDDPDGDVDFLWTLVEAELDSGVFGDLNGDSLPDCQMRDQIALLFGYTLADEEYDIRLDYDLDGDTDSADEAVFLSLTCPWPLGDANCDGAVGFGDVNAFVLAVQAGEQAYLAEYPDCRWLNSDIDCDGVVSFGDINPFVDCMVVGVCSCPVN